MIITKVKLNPFGGLSANEIILKKGLNIIVGPNETGKSTIFHAIQKVLFTPSRLSKNKFEKEMERYLPLGRGDTIKVELQYQYGDKPYTLKRIWGASQSAELLLPDGNVLTNEEAIAEQLEGLLPAKEGTYKSVLMTYQSGLAKTIDDLIHDYPDTLYSLGDIIRKSILETDGVSIDKFRDTIEEMYDENFSRWDPIQNYPEGGRGIENPFKRGVGNILQAFYTKETVKSHLENARQFEEEFDRINQQILDCDKKVSEKVTYLKENKKAVQDAKERRVLNAEADALKLKIDKLKEVNNDWPIIETKISEIENILPKCERKLITLQKEKDDAEGQEKNRELRENVFRVETRKNVLEEAEKKLQSIKILTNENLENIRNAYAEVQQLKASLTAGKLAINFIAKKDISFSVQKDFEELLSKELKENDSIQFEAGGRLKLEHSDWLIEVTSGENKIEEMVEKYRKADENLNDFLGKYEIQSLEEAITSNQSYNKHLDDVTKAREYLDEELSPYSYEELGMKIKELGHEAETRPLALIIQELSGIQNDIQNKNDRLNEFQDKVEEFIKEYEDKNTLLLKLAEEVRQEKEIKDKIQNLTPLPEGIEDVNLFIEEYEKAEEDLEFEKEEKNDLILERTEFERDMPQESAEELHTQLIETEETFEKVLKTGKAITQIKVLTLDLLDQMDSDTYRDLKKDLEQYVAVMTNNRYSKVELDEGLPQGFLRSDGGLLPYELLSAGTKDVLALALRLAMSNHFLKDSDGFLIMDDPLVDLDPERQKNAAELLKTFAENKQILLFTCHPSHAELLGGHQIML